ncbi:AMP-binding protein [Frigoribacterium sp. CG_9.8]|uniref:AMP-binding protein n=1 Tax=Frigoribacterium sp. CG_9.8 TaxID=2787733 RepID=UPI001A186D5C|nr:acyl-CoA synthetase (AMP-forming)/AMP-acid ligase II [Frigoribacterium sp. CG_9.8]
MIIERIALWCGEVGLTEAQFTERIRLAAVEGQFPANRLVPISTNDPVAGLVRALAVRTAGSIPLLGDERWDAHVWAQLRMHAGQDTIRSDTGWAAFSSGSTGSPRLILRSEASWSSSFAAVTELMQLQSTDAVYLPAPLSSSLSLFSVAHARAVGAAIVLPISHGFDPADLTHATVVHGTPHALRTIVESLENGQTPHRVRLAFVGGAHLDIALRRRAEALGMRVVSYYGAAELSFVAVDTDGLGYLAFPGVEVRINPSAGDAGTGDAGRLTLGELWVRSPYLASGYHASGSHASGSHASGSHASGYNASDGALRHAPGGWASVGDLVEVDSTHRLHFRGRLDGAILTGSATVVPEDVEMALRSIDGIEDAVVLGIPNASLGALVAVLIETTPGGATPTARDLRTHARSRFIPSHLPRRWYRTDHLPRTLSGKPDRDAVRRAIDNGEVTRLD